MNIIKVNPLTQINNSDKIRFSCFCGLRINDIISLRWKDMFVDSEQYCLAVYMQKTQKHLIYLPLSPETLK